MKKLILMRGLPGSGKSTLARKIQDEQHLQYCHGDAGRAYIISADHYFTVGDKYFFDPTRLRHAHNRCKWLCVQLMLDNAAVIIVDNTNIADREINDYREFATLYGYEVEIREPKTEWKYDPKICAKKNIHNVPEDVIERMLDKYHASSTTVS